MRRAKIVCTLGPASDSPEVLEAMVRAGMNVARLNFSHGTHEEHRRRVQRLRKISRAVGRPVTILQDLQGPKIRLGQFAGGSATVLKGSTVVLTTRKVKGTSEVIPTTARNVPKDVVEGDRVLLDDGRVVLLVEHVKGQDVTCRVVVGGELSDRKGLNLPNTALSIPSVTAKDIKDAAFGQALGVDYVALSFVRCAADVRKLRRHVSLLGSPIISKIEKPQAVANLEEISAASDGVMIARGDLGVEVPLEKLPGIQKRALHSNSRQGKPVIVATEMLESMIKNRRPTRAEVSDVANAIIDGADAVMLSAETAAGRYPVEAVETMAKIVVEAEKEPMSHGVVYEEPMDVSHGVAAAAVAAARRLSIDTIVAYTESGHTARIIAALRPEARVLALTPSADTVRRAGLYWGTTAHKVSRLSSTDAMLNQVRQECARGICAPGSLVVVVAGVPLNSAGNTNLMSINRV